MYENAARVGFFVHVYMKITKSNSFFASMVSDLVMMMSVEANMKAGAKFNGVPDIYVYDDIEELDATIEHSMIEILHEMRLPIKYFAMSLIEFCMLSGATKHISSGFKEGGFFQNIANKHASHIKNNGFGTTETLGEVLLSRENWNPMENETRKSYLHRVEKRANKLYDSKENRTQGNIDARAADWLWEQLCGDNYVTISENYGVSEETVKSDVQILRAQLDIKRPKGRPKMVKKVP